MREKDVRNELFMIDTERRLGISCKWEKKAVGITCFIQRYRLGVSD